MKHQISWEVIKSGQVAAHKDSTYKYVIETKLPERTVREFCTKFLHRAQYEAQNERQFNGSCSFPFGLDKFFKFYQDEENENIYHYFVCHPYCD